MGQPCFSRGEKYFREGKVQSVEVSAGGETVISTVSGSRGEVYDQDIDLDFTLAGGLHSVSGTCSCPVGFNCKHVAAVLLCVADRFGSGIRVSQQSVTVRPPEEEYLLHEGLRFWLGEWRDLCSRIRQC